MRDEGAGRRERVRRRKGMGREGGGGKRSVITGSECHAAPSATGSPHGSLPVGPRQRLREVVILGGSVIGSLESRKLSGD